MPLPTRRPPFVSGLLSLLALLTVFAPTAARGEDGLAAPDGNFRAGLWTFEWTGSLTDDWGPHDQLMAGGALGVSYYFVENVAASAQFSGLSVNQPGENAVAAEADLFLRHHLFHFDRYSFFLDVGGGLFQADAPVPENGTRFNFVFQSGAGLTCHLRDNLYLIGGARYYHQSNGDLEGDARNPSINGVRAYFGLLFTF